MLREELRKIWRPGRLALLVLFGFVFYTMFLEFYLNYFPNGPYQEGIFQIGVELVDRYGASLSPEEAADLEDQLPALYEEADGYVRNYTLGQKYGLETYSQYQQFYQDCLDSFIGTTGADTHQDYADAMVLTNYLQSDATDNICGRVEAVKWYLEQYEAARQKAIGGPKTWEYLSGWEYRHARTAFYGSDGAWQNILPPEVPETVSAYLGYLLVWVCLAQCLLLTPSPVSDRMSRMKALQWSSVRGKRVERTQLLAFLLSSFLLTASQFLLFGGLLLSKGITSFWSCRMYSFLEPDFFCWPNWTLGTWCLLLTCLCLLTALGVAALLFVLALYSGNYITMLMKLLPLFLVTALLCPRLTGMAFYYSNSLYQAAKLPFTEVVIVLAVLLAGVLLCLSVLRRRGRQELLESQ